ncbi:MAG: hypothetical protein IKT94_00475 [Rikenellaceae bacterium]|nr:hypothetical protein [Rikenellaceae bacterium]
MLLCIALFAAFVGLSAESNVRSIKGELCTTTQQEQLCAGDGRYDLHLAIENNSRFVAPPLADRIASVSVRIISARNYKTNNNQSVEHRAGINFSNHNLKADRDTRLYRLSPASIRIKYIYSLRRIII